MLDLSLPENYYILANSVFDFLSHAKENNSTCECCESLVAHVQDVNIQPIMDQIRVFCDNCDYLISVFTVMSTIPEEITQSEVEQVSRFIQGADFTACLYEFLKSQHV